MRHLIAENVLIDGEFVPAHIEVDDEHGTIRRIRRFAAGEATRQAAVTKARDVAAGRGIQVLKPRLMVLPGNVDTHVHINEPGRTHWEGFATGTMAATLGGATSIIDMPLNAIPPTVSTEALGVKERAATGQQHVDIGFWGGIVPGNLDQLQPLWEAGVFGFKAFLADSGVPEFPPVDAAELTAAMHEVARFGGQVLVHAEDPGVLAGAQGKNGSAKAVRSYPTWAATRPVDAEKQAIATVINAVRETGCHGHILHLASAAALEMIADARAEGLPLTVETCPHYLCFEAETVPDGAAAFKCCPPIRDSGNRDALWEGLTEGIIDAVVSDHSPASADAKYRGAGDLEQAWGGISGLQVAFTAVADAARRRGISLAQVSRWMSTAPAKLANLETVKGSITIGNDADFLIYDPDEQQRISASGLAHKNPISAYDGYELRGAVVSSVLRGVELFSYADPSATVIQRGRFLRGPGFLPEREVHAAETDPAEGGDAAAHPRQADVERTPEQLLQSW